MSEHWTLPLSAVSYRLLRRRLRLLYRGMVYLLHQRQGVQRDGGACQMLRGEDYFLRAARVNSMWRCNLVGDMPLTRL